MVAFVCPADSAMPSQFVLVFRIVRLQNLWPTPPVVALELNADVTPPQLIVIPGLGACSRAYRRIRFGQSYGGQQINGSAYVEHNPASRTIGICQSDTISQTSGAAVIQD